ncbi:MULTISPECIES: hypothetical protein [Actinomyces]|uniref:Uncharacterized protein n=1 Tax=Actinomyces respiraculi TaxID=2744574 RepID=A0A7T0PX41_9ACTO|nr:MULTISPECIES: hypothetical protein [Actinomyces]QPL05495.1 hypothetical protein ID810_00360 [Actinomyces respiraculi]
MSTDRNIASEEQEFILANARRLSRNLSITWSQGTRYDDVMLLVANLLDAHADTGIELQSWPVALDVVTSHLAQDDIGQRFLERAKLVPWFTVVGTRRDHRRDAVAVIAGRRVVDVAIGCWQQQVQAPSAAAAVEIALRETAVTFSTG